MRIILIWGAVAGTHPSLLILHEYMRGVKDYFHFFENTYPQLIHRISTDLSTDALCASIKTKYKN